MNDRDQEDEQPRVQATAWEVVLARAVIKICDEIGLKDRDQEWLELYNTLKPLAEHKLRGGRRERTVLGGVARNA